MGEDQKGLLDDLSPTPRPSLSFDGPRDTEPLSVGRGRCLGSRDPTETRRFERGIQREKIREENRKTVSGSYLLTGWKSEQESSGGWTFRVRGGCL